MKLHSNNTDEILRISGYGDGYIVVAEQRVEITFALHAGSIHALDGILDLDALGWPALGFMHGSPPEILVLGTGNSQLFPPAEVYAELAFRRIGLEAMSTPAACRTYNILRSEGRNVSAILMPPKGMGPS